MCRYRSFLIGGAKKRHDKISSPRPIGKHIQVLQHNPPNSCRVDRSPWRQFRANSGHYAYVRRLLGGWKKLRLLAQVIRLPLGSGCW
jgi:hypothetical protein